MAAREKILILVTGGILLRAAHVQAIETRWPYFVAKC